MFFRKLEEREDALDGGFIRPYGTLLGAEIKINGEKFREKIVARRLMLVVVDKIRIICSHKALLLTLIERNATGD